MKIGFEKVILVAFIGIFPKPKVCIDAGPNME